MARFSRAARQGDSERGRCSIPIHSRHHHCPHRRGGIFNGDSSPNVFIEGVAAVRLGDGGSCNCPHNGTFQATDSSNSVFINGKGAIRIKDETTCLTCGRKGYVTTACNTVFIGD